MAQQIENDQLGRIALRISPAVFDVYTKYRTLFAYIVSGGTGAFVNLFSLFILTHVFGLWYLFSSILAFCLAFGVSFYLQKYWTFRDSSTEGLQKQATLYLFVQLVNLLINTALMYALVDGLGIWYMAAQVLTSGMIAAESFFVYRAFIFKPIG